MTNGNANWARQHDWYYGEQNSDKGVIVLVRCDMEKGKILKFNDVQELAEWAGY